MEFFGVIKLILTFGICSFLSGIYVYKYGVETKNKTELEIIEEFNKY